MDVEALDGFVDEGAYDLGGCVLDCVLGFGDGGGDFRFGLGDGLSYVVFYSVDCFFGVGAEGG